MQTARDIMTENLVTIGPNATVQEAINLLIQEQISGLPVVDDHGKLIGIVTEFALLAIAYDENICQERVLKHMTQNLITVGPDESIRKVADLCLVHRVRRVPVVEDGRLLGVIARRDVLVGVYKALPQECFIGAGET